ncbi:hypothetical protein Tsp_10066 [Trichinella spiralis]|uniref:hypothetical protein n=1 Tax=Trichinella spiralis TaxID=6334 RepID=UPI0001EFCF3B|nr:hypothetical protein Tsp_10066 [Trichinella spiralis]
MIQIGDKFFEYNVKLNNLHNSDATFIISCHILARKIIKISLFLLLRKIIRRFLYVASSMPNIHGISSRWASVALRDMILPTVYLMEHLVSYRHAVLDFLSSLLHENMLFDIFQIRCAHFGIELPLPQTRGHTRESLCRLIWSLNNAIVRKSKRGAAEIFKVISTVYTGVGVIICNSSGH